MSKKLHPLHPAVNAYWTPNVADYEAMMKQAEWADQKPSGLPNFDPAFIEKLLKEAAAAEEKLKQKLLAQKEAKL